MPTGRGYHTKAHELSCFHRKAGHRKLSLPFIHDEMSFPDISSHFTKPTHRAYRSNAEQGTHNPLVLVGRSSSERPSMGNVGPRSGSAVTFNFSGDPRSEGASNSTRTLGQFLMQANDEVSRHAIFLDDVRTSAH